MFSVFLHLLQLTFPKAKLLLMSSYQEDINDWYHSLCLAIGYALVSSISSHQKINLIVILCAPFSLCPLLWHANL